MTEFLLKLCGVKLEDAGSVSSLSIRFGDLNSVGWVLLLGVALGAVVWWSYRQGMEPPLPLKRRRWLGFLRSLLFLLLLLVLLKPVIVFSLEGKIRRKLLVLVDRSASMAIQDPRKTEEDLRRVTLARGDKQGGSSTPSRMELVQTVFSNPKFNLLEKWREENDVELYAFDSEVTELPSDALESRADGQPAGAIHAEGTTTALGSAVRALLARTRGQPVAGIVIATDGANNSGSRPLDAAMAAGRQGAPLYIYGVGVTSPRDVLLADLFVPDVLFVEEEAIATVRVRGQGITGERAQVGLSLDGQEVASQEIIFDGTGEQVITLPFVPQEAGDVTLTVTIPELPEEVTAENNTETKQIKVIDEEIKVLLVEQAPRWEYRYLEAVLLRDRRMKASIFLADGDPSFAAVEGSHYIAKLPSDRATMSEFDLVILGDVNPDILGIKLMEEFEIFVSKFGGAMVFIAGPEFNAAAYKGTPLEKLLPVELPRVPNNTRDAKLPVKVELTEAGADHSLLRFSSQAEVNRKIWQSFPPIYWIQEVDRAKPGAQVLAVDSDPARQSAAGKMPVIALQNYGLGQVLYLGTDNLWRWRANDPHDYYRRLYSQVVQKMGMTHLLGGKRTQLSSSAPEINTGERITLYARAYDEAYQPLTRSELSGNYFVQEKPDGPWSEPVPLTFRASPDQPGMFRADLVATQAGQYKFSVETDDTITAEFLVKAPKFESGATEMNEKLLVEMAQASGGGFFREENLQDLPKVVQSKQEAVRTLTEADLWSSPIFLLLIVAVASAEWIARKRSQLK